MEYTHVSRTMSRPAARRGSEQHLKWRLPTTPWSGAAAILIIACALATAQADPTLRRSALSGGSVAVVSGSIRLQATVGEAGVISSRTHGSGYAVALGFHSGRASGVSVAAPAYASPRVNALVSITPNPVTSDAHMSFDAAAPATAEITIYDIAGRRLVGAMQRTVGAGRHTITLPSALFPRGSGGPQVVFVSLRLGEWYGTRRVVVLNF